MQVRLEGLRTGVETGIDPRLFGAGWETERAEMRGLGGREAWEIRRIRGEKRRRRREGTEPSAGRGTVPGKEEEAVVAGDDEEETAGWLDKPDLGMVGGRQRLGMLDGKHHAHVRALALDRQRD